MITKEEFKDLIQKQQSWDKRIDQVSEVLGNICLLDFDWVEYAAMLFEKTLSLLFTEEGVDDIDWWIYEKDGRQEMKMWDKDNNEIPTETLDDLWEIVKDYRK